MFFAETFDLCLSGSVSSNSRLQMSRSRSNEPSVNAIGVDRAKDGQSAVGEASPPSNPNTSPDLEGVPTHVPPYIPQLHAYSSWADVRAMVTLPADLPLHAPA